MWGGDGGDIFVWHSITEMGSTVDANSDTVGDFNAAIGDLIVLNLIRRRWQRRERRHRLLVHRYRVQPLHAAGQVLLAPRLESRTYILLNTTAMSPLIGVIRVLGVHAVDASWFVL